MTGITHTPVTLSDHEDGLSLGLAKAGHVYSVDHLR